MEIKNKIRNHLHPQPPIIVRIQQANCKSIPSSSTLVATSTILSLANQNSKSEIHPSNNTTAQQPSFSP
jgi:hypothetical protein